MAVADRSAEPPGHQAGRRVGAAPSARGNEDSNGLALIVWRLGLGVDNRRNQKRKKTGGKRQGQKKMFSKRSHNSSFLL